MVIPNRVSTVVDVICIPSMDTASGLLVLGSDWHLPTIGYKIFETGSSFHEG